jgi:thiol-disulfide isomerase/thioredoxin
MVRAMAILVSVFAVLACSPKSETSSPQRTSLNSPESNAVPNKNGTAAPLATVSTSASSALEGLGLMVFPEPQTIPPIELTSLAGKKVTLADYKGKYVFLNFWATWCPPCRQEMPSIQKMSDTLTGPDFSVLAVSVGEDLGTVSSFLKKTPYTFPIVLDPRGENSVMFVGRGIPTTYILDRQGRAIAGTVGGRTWDGPESLDAFRSLFAKKEK